MRTINPPTHDAILHCFTVIVRRNQRSAAITLASVLASVTSANDHVAIVLLELVPVLCLASIEIYRVRLYPIEYVWRQVAHVSVVVVGRVSPTVHKVVSQICSSTSLG